MNATGNDDARPQGIINQPAGCSGKRPVAAAPRAKRYHRKPCAPPSFPQPARAATTRGRSMSAPASQPGSAMGPGVLTPALLLLLVALQVALFAHASLVTDSGRDLANAWAVGHGGPYPSYGPGLFGHWQLGPVWFWLLALPLRLGSSLSQVAICVGLLAAAKIPLAWGLGRSLVDARLGLLAALFIALPGWVSESSLVITHTSVIETSLLATAWPALAAWRQHRPGLALLACGMLALALHAHPTTLIAAPAVALALWRAVLLPHRWGWLAACIVAFLLPFLPALWAEMLAGWPQADNTLSWLQEASPVARLARLPAVLGALLAGGAWLAGNYLLPAPMATLWWPAHAVIGMLALGGGARLLLRGARLDGGERAARQALLRLLPASLAAVVFIVLLRDATPSWMVAVLAPCGAFLLALGWRGLPWQRHWAALALAALALASVAVGAAELRQRMQLQEAGRILLPAGSFDDIAGWHHAHRAPSPWLSIGQFDALARAACAGPDPLTLHGELAMAFDFSQGVAARLHCAPGHLPRLGGRAGASHLAGIPRALAASLGMLPEPMDYGHVLRVPRAVLAPEQGRRADVDVRYRVDRQAELNAGGEQFLHGELACEPGEWLVATNLMPVVNPWTLTLRDGGGAELAPRLTTLAARYHACNGETVRWQLRTPDPASIDLVVVRSDNRAL